MVKEPVGNERGKKNERGASAASFGTTRALTLAAALRRTKREEVESIARKVVVEEVGRLELGEEGERP